MYTEYFTYTTKVAGLSFRAAASAYLVLVIIMIYLLLFLVSGSGPTRSIPI